MRNAGLFKLGFHAGAIGDAAARVLFPPRCLACASHVVRPGTLCGTCWPELRLIEQPWCPVMGTPFSREMGEGFLSAEAIATPPPFGRLRSAVLHQGAAQRIAGDLKYRDRTDLAPWMARWMMRAGAELLADAPVIVPVPLHRRRFFQRRYNQSAELARAIAGLSGLQFAPDAVWRIKKTRQQVGLRAQERVENVRGAFFVPGAGAMLIRGRHVLIVDDVYTTGATVSALARVLKRKGAACVDVLTFSRALPGRIDEVADAGFG